MEVKGFIIAVLEKRGGTSAKTGNAWAMQSYVIETVEQHPRHVVFEVFGEDKISEFNIQKDEEMTVFFDVDAREYQGKWYNSIRAWKVEKTGRMMVQGAGSSPNNGQAGNAAPPTAGAGTGAVANGGDTGAENSDLPF